MDDWVFLEDASPVIVDDFWYNLIEGGYIEIEKLLFSEDDILAVKEAIEVLESFKDALEEAGLLEEC